MDHGRKWEDMERDCLVCIFQRLDLKELTVSIPFVCKTWFLASLSPLCWRVLDFRQLDFMPGSKFTKEFGMRYPHSSSSSLSSFSSSSWCFSFSAFMKFAVSRSCGSATELRFPLFFNVSMEDLVYASIKCPRLKILGMDSVKPEDEVQLAVLIGKWKELEELEMETGPSDSNSFSELAAEISLGCRKFRGLSMTGAIKMEDAAAIIKFLPKLKKLDLSRSYLPRNVLLVIMDGCRELTELSVNDCIGFRADDDQHILRRARGLIKFEHMGSKLNEDFRYACMASIGHSTAYCMPRRASLD